MKPEPETDTRPRIDASTRAEEETTASFDQGAESGRRTERPTPADEYEAQARAGRALPLDPADETDRYDRPDRALMASEEEDET